MNNVTREHLAKIAERTLNEVLEMEWAEARNWYWTLHDAERRYFTEEHLDLWMEVLDHLANMCFECLEGEKNLSQSEKI